MMRGIRDRGAFGSTGLVSLALATVVLIGGCDTAPRNEGDWFAGGDERLPTEETLRMTARILAAKGEFAQAEFTVERMFVMFPDRVGTYTEAAELLLRQGRVAEAVGVLNAGLERLPDNPVLLNDRGLCHLLAGDPTSASVDFDAAHAIDPADADFVANAALAAALRGDEARARRLWSQVVTPAITEENIRIAVSSKAVTGAEQP